MADMLQNLLSKADLLIVFLGMFALVWRSLSIAHDLSKLALQGPPPAPAPVPVPATQSPSPESTATHTTAPAQTVVLDQAFVDAVKKFEGYAPKAKWDYKQYTNGYGTKANSADEVVSEAEAERRLLAELGSALSAVKAFAPANTPVGVEQGLTDAVFNLGTSWMQAGLGQAVKSGDWASAKEHLLQYNHAGGQVLDGLTKRRQAEVSWFDNPL